MSKSKGGVRIRRLSYQADPSGPRMRYGLAWFLLQALAFRVGLWGLAVVFAGAAGLAAWQLAGAWQKAKREPEPWLCAVLAAAIPLVAAVDSAVIGAVVLGGVLVGAVAAAFLLREPMRVIAAVGIDIQSWLFVGLATAAPIIAYRFEPGAALVLLIYVNIYDAGAFMIGVESPNLYEGPIAGLVGIAVAGFAVAVLAIPPFTHQTAALFAVLAGFLSILGPLAGSFLLPRFDAEAPALRRIDTLLVLGPVWAWSIGLLMASLT
ncbi:MAG: hypothetical protein ACC652_12565 [Acidimicrobiales bacterium]